MPVEVTTRDGIRHNVKACSSMVLKTLTSSRNVLYHGMLKCMAGYLKLVFNVIFKLTIN